MACKSLGTASYFNIFTLGNHIQSNTDAEGRVAVAGNAIYINYSIGNDLEVSRTRADLIVGGNMDITGGTNFSGNSVISTEGSVIRYTMTNNNGVQNQPLIQNIIDFETEGNYLRCLSEQFANQTPNGVVNIQPWGSVYLQGTNPDLNIFTFDGTNIEGSGYSLATINAIDIQVPSGSTVLINVLGENLSFGSYSIFF